MTDGAKQDPPSLDEFSQRLDAARGVKEAKENSRRTGSVALGRAFRVGSELLAALLVGALLGWGLDTVFSSRPWLMLVGILFGFAAGILNVNRAFKESNGEAQKD
ncbi:MAG TPA: AtpZ/AtpI family protein [Parvularculaceae bacterium]|nr:AtpZ/AtpI family protein [Parvularculaceae bacterium]HNS86854.1 AtpZ/AtpI family protein [Parvularculaceae bacterium]